MTSSVNINNLLTFGDVAHELGYAEGSVRRLAAEGKIGCVKIGGRTRFRPEHVEAFIKERPACSVVSPVKARAKRAGR